MTKHEKKFGLIDVSVEVDEFNQLVFEASQSFNGNAECKCGFVGATYKATGAGRWDGCWDLKLFDSEGHNPHFCELSDLIEALQWVEAKRIELVRGAE